MVKKIKLFNYLIVILLMLSPLYLYADQQLSRTIVFGWDSHPQIDRINYFLLSWSDQQGGPYAKLAIISKEDAVDNQQDIEAVVSGPEESTVTRYFVLKACGDITFLPGPDWCENHGPCSEGEGDCDSDSECESGLVCSQDVGEKYGWPAARDVCENSDGSTVPIEGTTVNRCSDPSNEIAYDFSIPFAGYQVPVNFRIIIEQQ
jgi:hypothetical protein